MKYFVRINVECVDIVVDVLREEGVEEAEGVGII
jgi:hypothetical protein